MADYKGVLVPEYTDHADGPQAFKDVVDGVDHLFLKKAGGEIVSITIGVNADWHVREDDRGKLVFSIAGIEQASFDDAGDAYFRHGIFTRDLSVSHQISLGGDKNWTIAEDTRGKILFTVDGQEQASFNIDGDCFFRHGVFTRDVTASHFIRAPHFTASPGETLLVVQGPAPTNSQMRIHDDGRIIFYSHGGHETLRFDPVKHRWVFDVRPEGI